MSDTLITNEDSRCEQNIEIPVCVSEVINPRTLPECPSKLAKPKLTLGKRVVKIPVVLAERTIQIDIESTIRLERPALEIKRIRKNLFLTQCRLIPKAAKLFLKGFIRKNIEYSTVKCIHDATISGDIVHTTANVPFACVVKIPFTTPPVIVNNEGPLEIEFFNPDFLGKDTREQDFESIERFNERIFCELIRVRFDEADIEIDGRPVGGNFPEETIFRSFTEKLVVNLTLKILQNQQLRVKSTCTDP